MMLEPGDSRQQTTEGICRHRVWEGYHRRFDEHNAEKSAPQLAPTIDVANLAPVRAHESFDWGTAFDATAMSGQVRFRLSNELRAHSIQARFFFDSLVRELEVLGHIEVKNPHTVPDCGR